MQDIRYGFRMLLKNWKVASVAAFSLGVAMTFSVAALSIFNGVLLRPPFAAAPDQLVTVYTSTASHEFDGVSYQDYKYYRDNSQSFSGVAAFPSQISKLRLTHGDRDETGTMEVTSDNYFGVMGIRPALGQLFAAGDDGKSTPSAVLTYSCWKKWGADPKIVGKTVVLNRHTLTIVGVAPKNFTGVVFGFGRTLLSRWELARRYCRARKR